MVNVNTLAEKINKELPSVSDTVINSAGVETKKNLSQTRKPSTPEIFLECCVARKKPIRCEKTKPQARTLIISWWFMACSHVLIFAVIGLNTINILEIFQVFTVFPVTL